MLLVPTSVRTSFQKQRELRELREMNSVISTMFLNFVILSTLEYLDAYSLQQLFLTNKKMFDRYNTREIWNTLINQTLKLKNKKKYNRMNCIDLKKMLHLTRLLKRHDPRVLAAEITSLKQWKLLSCVLRHSTDQRGYVCTLKLIRDSKMFRYIIKPVQCAVKLLISSTTNRHNKVYGSYTRLVKTSHKAILLSEIPIILSTDIR
jgi:hypothetical protein